ncbi:unnamed protein product [Arctogadus glacialis]
MGTLSHSAEVSGWSVGRKALPRAELPSVHSKDNSQPGRRAGTDLWLRDRRQKESSGAKLPTVTTYETLIALPTTAPRDLANDEERSHREILVRVGPRSGPVCDATGLAIADHPSAHVVFPVGGARDQTPP